MGFFSLYFGSTGTVDTSNLAEQIAARLAGTAALNVYSPATAGTLDLFLGDSYLTANGRSLIVTKQPNETHWPATLNTVALYAQPSDQLAELLGAGAASAKISGLACTVLRASDDVGGGLYQSFRIDLTASNLAPLVYRPEVGPWGYVFQLKANGPSATATLRAGSMAVRPDLSA